MNDKELLATKIEGNYKSLLKNCSCYNKKLEQLQSNWNSLREWLEDSSYVSVYGDGSEFKTYIESQKVLDKMNELEGVDNENN